MFKTALLAATLAIGCEAKVEGKALGQMALEPVDAVEATVDAVEATFQTTWTLSPEAEALKIAHPQLSHGLVSVCDQNWEDLQKHDAGINGRSIPIGKVFSVYVNRRARGKKDGQKEHEFTIAELQQQAQEMDLNGDGKVTFEESVLDFYQRSQETVSIIQNPHPLTDTKAKGLGLLELQGSCAIYSSAAADDKYKSLYPGNTYALGASKAYNYLVYSSIYEAGFAWHGGTFETGCYTAKASKWGYVGLGAAVAAVFTWIDVPIGSPASTFKTFVGESDFSSASLSLPTPLVSADASATVYSIDGIKVGGAVGLGTSFDLISFLSFDIGSGSVITEWLNW